MLCILSSHPFLPIYVDIMHIRRKTNIFFVCTFMFSTVPRNRTVYQFLSCFFSFFSQIHFVVVIIYSQYYLQMKTTTTTTTEKTMQISCVVEVTGCTLDATMMGIRRELISFYFNCCLLLLTGYNELLNYPNKCFYELDFVLCYIRFRFFLSVFLFCFRFVVWLLFLDILYKSMFLDVHARGTQHTFYALVYNMGALC